MVVKFIKSYSRTDNQKYQYTSMLRHKGTVIAFATDDMRQIKDYWSEFQKLFYPSDVNGVGLGVAREFKIL